MQVSKKESNLYRSVSPLCSYVASLRPRPRSRKVCTCQRGTCLSTECTYVLLNGTYIHAAALSGPRVASDNSQPPRMNSYWLRFGWSLRGNLHRYLEHRNSAYVESPQQSGTEKELNNVDVRLVDGFDSQHCILEPPRDSSLIRQ